MEHGLTVQIDHREALLCLYWFILHVCKFDEYLISLFEIFVDDLLVVGSSVVVLFSQIRYLLLFKFNQSLEILIVDDKLLDINANHEENECQQETRYVTI